MSSVLHPVGPEDKGTYWRRRLVVVLALVVVAVLVALGVRALTTSDDAQAQGPTKLDPSTVATTGATADATTPGATPTGTPGATPSGSATAPTATTAAGACSDQSLAVTLTTAATTYGPGKAPNLVLTVENTSQTPCTVETSSAVRVLTVTDASGAQVWSSAHCQTRGESVTDQLAPGQTRSKTTTWSRQRSEAGCPTGQPAVEPGTYTVNGTWDGVAAAPITLALTG
ncbi:hypothetical protein AB2L28_09720 [Kineococcus sp. TBRC 1896]|uniref:DUF4232 domain-containing protein n=1 Tax=Kineococcus mangrovi TaxID=1660183 RepID=A0ABV4I1F8_9ACTN